MIITCSECVSLAVVIQHAMRTRRIILLSVTCLALPYFFSHYLINGMIFGGKKLSNVKCVFWCSLQFLSGTFLILRRNERDKIVNVHRFSCKVPVILVIFK